MFAIDGIGLFLLNKTRFRDKFGLIFPNKFGPTSHSRMNSVLQDIVAPFFDLRLAALHAADQVRATVKTRDPEQLARLHTQRVGSL